jgi:hypothetical protein
VQHGVGGDIHGFFGEINVFLQLSSMGLFGIKSSCLYPETPMLQEVLLSKVTPFSQAKTVFYSPASDTNDCLWRETCVSSTQLNRPIWDIYSLPQL